LTIVPDQKNDDDLIANIALRGIFQPGNQEKTIVKRVSISAGFCKPGQYTIKRLVKALDTALTSGCLD
jgi:hypothetical protein